MDEMNEVSWETKLSQQFSVIHRAKQHVAGPIKSNQVLTITEE